MVETGRSPTHGKTRREKAPGGFVRANVFRLAFHVMFVRKYHAAAGKRKIPAENKKMESVWQRPWSLPVGEDHRKQALC